MRRAFFFFGGAAAMDSLSALSFHGAGRAFGVRSDGGFGATARPPAVPCGWTTSGGGGAGGAD